MKRLTTSINSSKKVNDDKSKVGYKFSDAKGVVEKGKEYLESILECFDVSNIPKWCDYNGKIDKDECIKR